MVGPWWTGQPGGPDSPQVDLPISGADRRQGGEPEEEAELIPHLLDRFL